MVNNIGPQYIGEKALLHSVMVNVEIVGQRDSYRQVSFTFKGAVCSEWLRLERGMESLLVEILVKFKGTTTMPKLLPVPCKNSCI